MQRRGDQPCALQHLERAQVLDQAVAERAVELQPVAVRAHAAVADQVARVLHREQVLAGRHRARRSARPVRPAARSRADRRLPRTRTARRRAGPWRRRWRWPGRSGRWRRPRGGSRPAACAAPPRCACRSSASGAPPIFIFTTDVAAVEVALHLVLQAFEALAGIVVAAGGVDEDLAGRPAIAVALGQQAEQRLALDLGDGVPDRHVDRAHGDRALAMAARLLVA